MKNILNQIIFKIGIDVVASLNIDDSTFSDVDNLKTILSVQYDVKEEEIEVYYTQKEIKKEFGESFISVTGKLCIYNDLWNVEVVEGLSLVNWVDVTTEEGINTLSDYKYLGKADELVKFN